jgi:hypothetical protein
MQGGFSGFVLMGTAILMVMMRYMIDMLDHMLDTFLAGRLPLHQMRELRFGGHQWLQRKQYHQH